MKHFWGRCKDADPSKMCFPPRRRANFQKIAAQRTNSVTNAFWVCAGAGTGTRFGAKRGFAGGSWGVLGAFFWGAAAHRGSERAPWRCLSPPGAALGRVWGLRKPSWILFEASRSPAGTFLGTSGNRFGTFLAPPKAFQIAIASTDTDTNRHDQEISHARRKKGSAEWAKPS